MTGTRLSTAQLDPRRRKLHIRAWHRGMREMDLVFGPFADAHLERMDDPSLDAFESLLEENDQDLYRWVLGSQEPPERVRGPLFDSVIAYRQSIRPSEQPL